MCGLAQYTHLLFALIEPFTCELCVIWRRCKLELVLANHVIPHAFSSECLATLTEQSKQSHVPLRPYLLP